MNFVKIGSNAIIKIDTIIGARYNAEAKKIFVRMITNNIETVPFSNITQEEADVFFDTLNNSIMYNTCNPPVFNA